MLKRTRIMLQTKLLLIEYATVNGKDKNHWKLAAIRSIKNLLLQIDFNVEVIPDTNSDRLQNLLCSLKGESLTKEEKILVEELIIFS